MNRQIYVDTNIFLYCAQGHKPNLHYFCQMSTKFLDEPQGEYFVSDLVILEVEHQLVTYQHEYKGAKAVRRRLYGCVNLPTDSRAAMIRELANAYFDDESEEGWQGGTNDANDRIHAATASVFGLSFLATWDEAFRGRQERIDVVNAQLGCSPLALVWPRS